MRFRMRLILSFLLVALLPMLMLNRYAFFFFHHYSKQALEAEMVRSARLTGELFRLEMDAEQRAAVLAVHAADTESRLRYFNAAGDLLLDVGESPGLDALADTEIRRALETGAYAARWELLPDRSRVYYFSALPSVDTDGGVVTGVAQVIRHTGAVTRALLRMKEHQTRITWWTAGLSFTLALLFALLLARRLRRLRAAADRYARTGDSSGFTLRGRDEFTALAEAFQKMADDLEARQTYNRDFVLTTLHELRTPLTAMRGAADLLHRGDLPEADRQRFAGNIQTQAERLNRLVEELGALTALDVDLPREPAGLMEAGMLITEIVDRVRGAFSVPIHLEGGDLQAVVRVRPGRMEQALLNLLENAERYTPEGSGIEITLTEEGARLCVRVRDHGPGIAPEDVDRIFRRFFTTVPRGETSRQGRGLGLSVVETILRAHDGSVRAGNHPEGGAVFDLLLPIVPSSALSNVSGSDRILT